MASNAVHRIETDNVTHTDDHTFSGALTATGTESHTGTETHTGAVTLSGTTTISGPAVLSGGVTTSGNAVKSEGTLAAAGSNQATAGAVTKDITIVTASNGAKGVVLPTGVAGMQLTVINSVASALIVYPAGAGTIDGGASVTHPASKVAIYSCTAADVWYSMTGA